MKIKNQDILNFVSTSFVEKRLPVRVAYAISVNLSEAQAAVKAYDEQRKVLLKKYAVVGEDGEPIIENGTYKINDEKLEKWNEEIKELLETETEMNVTTFSLDDLAKCDGPDFDNLTISEITILKFMIKK